MTTFSIITPTYNRVRYLYRVFNGMVAQTFRNFEWIVVDDGSTDDTAALVDFWISKNKIRIMYVYQENGGKHKAVNTGIKLANGKYILIHDSDDSMLPDALENIIKLWQSASVIGKGRCGIVRTQCIDEKGERVGRKYPNNLFIVNGLQLKHVLRIRDEKWNCVRADIMRQYNWPNINGCRFVPESLVWNKIERKYDIVVSNILTRIYFRHDPRNNLTLRDRINIICENAESYMAWYLDEISDVEFLYRNPAHFMIFGVRFWRLAAIAGLEKGLHIIRATSLSRACYVVLGISAPIGLAAFAFEKIINRLGVKY